MALGKILESEGNKRALGIGMMILSAIPFFAPISSYLFTTGASLGGIGVVHDLIAKKKKEQENDEAYSENGI